MKKILKTSAWDAELDTSVCDKYNNAELTITLKLGFKQINPLGGAKSGMYHDYGDKNEKARKIVKWSPKSWLTWKQNFISSAQSYWNGKFWLINNFSEFEYQNGESKYIPNIWCKFKLMGSDASPGFKDHFTIDVVRLDKSESWFGSHANLYDNLDINSVKKGVDSKGNPIMQRAHVHEIGHLLGLGHVDIGKLHCPSSGNTNLSPCYGVKDIDKFSVMGRGMQLNSSHAKPWRNAMIKMTKKGNILSPKDWEAKMVRHYPRTPQEVKNNIFITVKPQR